MPSVLQEIAQRFEAVDPAKAKELRRIEQVYIGFGLSDGLAVQINDSALNCGAASPMRGITLT
jgi:reverse gyrase